MVRSQDPLADLALAASGIVALRWDLARDEVSWSPGADGVLRVGRAVLSSPVSFYRAVAEEDRLVVRRALGAALASDGRVRARFRLHAGVVRGAVRQPRWVDLRGRVLCDERGRPVEMIATLVDVSEERAAEDAVLGALREAEGELRRQM